MNVVFSILAAAAGLFSILILIRIISSWFGNLAESKPLEIISFLTDPYLDFFRRNFNIRVGFMDFSVLVGIVCISIVQNLLYRLSKEQVISVGYILAILLTAAWSIVSFMLVFFIIVIIIRMIGYLVNCDLYSPFWRMVDAISQPVLYKINRIIFGNKIIAYLKGMIVSSIALAVIWLAGGSLVKLFAELIVRLPF